MTKICQVIGLVKGPISFPPEHTVHSGAHMLPAPMNCFLHLQIDAYATGAYATSIYISFFSLTNQCLHYWHL